uniref:Uncharacterized protein n=1 Tax=Steinernema glaseri TaxID=37863 RepID=A0A1I7ZJF5_9BILA
MGWAQRCSPEPLELKPEDLVVTLQKGDRGGDNSTQRLRRPEGEEHQELNLLPGRNLFGQHHIGDEPRRGRPTDSSSIMGTQR